MEKLLILFFGVALSLSSCISPTKLMQTWVGHSKAELYRSWGPPTQVTEDGAGGQILVYDEDVSTGQTPGTAYRNVYGGVSYTNPQQNGYTRRRMFYVHSNGIIYDYNWEGL